MKAAATWPVRLAWAPARLRVRTENGPDDRSPRAAQIRRGLAWTMAISLGVVVVGNLIADLDDLGSSASGDIWANGAFASHVVVKEIILFGHTGVAEDVVAADAMIVTPDGVFHGPGGLTAVSEALHRSIADPRLMVESVGREGEVVTLRWTLTGMIREPILGIAPTTKPAFVTGEFVIVIQAGIVQRFVALVDEEAQPAAAVAG
jgi:hypothetical protein